MDPIVSPEWVRANRADLLLLDVRGYNDARDPLIEYRLRHIEGARFVDRDRLTSREPGPGDGRHPLPAPAEFAAGLRALGIDGASRVVAYDDVAGASAARLVYLLRVCGVAAGLLDGGLAAWPGPVATGDPPVVSPGTVDLAGWPSELVLDAADLDDRDGLLLDARGAARYRGEVEPFDPVAGHIPGAVNVPFNDHIDGGGRFRHARELRERFAAAGVLDDDVICYCGSGVSACVNALAMEAAGLGRPALYVGSWSQWCSDPSRPVATGP